MDSNKAFLVIGITLLIVVLFNLAIYVMIKRKKESVGEVDLLRRAMKRARNPWQEEQDNLEALADQVSKLKNPNRNEPVNHED